MSLQDELQKIVDHYDMRAELYTSDADCAAGLADIARNALGPVSCSGCDARHPRDTDGFHVNPKGVLTRCAARTAQETRDAVSANTTP